MITYLAATSLDGYIAGTDGSIDAFVSDAEYLRSLFALYPETCPAPLRASFGVADEPARFDAVVMGAATYAAGLAVGVTDPYPLLRTFVVSRTLEAPGPPVTMVRSLGDLCDRLRESGVRSVWLAGGGTLAAAMLTADVIDELVLKVNPVVLGDGVRLFAGATAPARFTPVRVRELPAGVRLVEHARAR